MVGRIFRRAGCPCARWRGRPGAILVAVAVLGLLVVAPFGSARAITRWGGNTWSEYTIANDLDSDRYLFQSTLGITARPPKTRLLDTRFSVRLNYFDANGETRTEASPIGSLGASVSGRQFQFELQHVRSANLTSVGQLVDTRTRRASLSLMPDDWPRLFATYLRTENRVSSVSTRISDAWTLNMDHHIGDLVLRSGYFRQIQHAGGQTGRVSQNILVGADFSRVILPGTQFTFAVDGNRHIADMPRSGESTVDTRTFRGGFSTRPRDWLAFDGNAKDEQTTTRGTFGGAYRSTHASLTSSVYPIPSTRIYGTLGTRAFDDGFLDRDIDFTILGASTSSKFTRASMVSLSAAHTNESDKSRGRNLRDHAVMNLNYLIAPSAQLRMIVGVTHNSFPGFIDPRRYDASGSLLQRDAFDDERAGFTYFATDFGQVFTKLSPQFGDWSTGVFVEAPTVSQYRTNRSIQLNFRPSRKSNMSARYSIDSQSRELGFGGVANEAWSGSLSYQSTRTTNISLSGVSASTGVGPTRGSVTGTISTVTRRRHRFSVSYARRVGTAGIGKEQLTVTAAIGMPRGGQIDVVGSIREPFTSSSENFWRIRFGRAF